MLEKHRGYVLFQQKIWAEYLDNLDDKIAFYKESAQGGHELGK